RSRRRRCCRGRRGWRRGGGGFVVARLLKERGWEVDVFLLGCSVDTLDRLPRDAATNAHAWARTGKVRSMNISDDSRKVRDDYETLDGADIIVDALFGTGLTRPLSRVWPLWSITHRAFDDGLWWFGDTCPPYVVAVDLPSGMCSDSGRELEGNDRSAAWHEARAHLTVTFHRPKVAHFTGDGPLHCTSLRVVDIGLSAEQELDEPIEELPHVRLLEAPRQAPFEGWIGKDRELHKYDHGHAVILSGGVGRGGAARLAARGALRVGAGLVTVGCPPAAVMENACRLDAVMLRAVDGAAGFMAFEGLEKVSAVCVGPGFGLGERCRAMVSAVLSGPGAKGSGGLETHPTDRRAVVLDADALTSFEGDPPALFSMLHERCVLTPHMGEFRRLFPDIAAKLDAPAERGPAHSKVDAAREAAARAGCTVLLKGADTVIASADGRCAINSAAYERAAPWLATAGSGDVLAGFITGLLARGLAPQAAAETGAWLHVECALRFGPGLIAEDLPEELPAVFRALDL
ncbi:MAG: NAD(P)H-hydrate dehydratase, partial [Pseudomonadota bacterium]